ncbi:MAG TPA: HAD-IIIA family hydrolase [Chitinispirillaceae bacterium]|nr:HAD-IIIA family hydrolase [Chitinispirillaceae bacterium]
MNNRAVFLDQNGTIIDDSMGLIRPVSEKSFYPGTIQALRTLYEKGILLFIVTNQSSVGLGKISYDQAVGFNNEVRGILKRNGVGIITTYSCMHKRDDNCECIKPNPHFLHKAKMNYEISLPDSFVIGDHPHDMELALNSGATGLYVLTGHGEKHRSELIDAFAIFPNLPEAAEFILQRLET